MTADPWALLRRARESVRFEARERANTDADSQESRERFALLDRIDAALKEYDAPVEWSNPHLGLTHFANVVTASVTVTRHWGGDWRWSISRVTVGPIEGHAKTEEEAKAAAVAAARRLQ